MTNGAAVGGAAERQDEVQRHRPGGGRIEFSALDVADQGPQCAGLLVEGVTEGASQLDVTLDLLKSVIRRLPGRSTRIAR